MSRSTLQGRSQQEGGLTRRRFLGRAGVFSAAALAGTNTVELPTTASPRTASRRPTGNLAARMGATIRRLTADGMVPEFTDDFILADLTLDPGRRFTEYSGDLSGRYLEALANMAPQHSARLTRLVARALREQKADGRFGREDLRFTAAETGTEHMPLLWGNGRLLVGLMASHAVTGDAATLSAARRLGDFVLGVQAAAGSLEVIERVELGGASGFICFTQLNEGLVLLWRATRDPRYLAAAREIGRLLRPRGVQHSHGYLTTLRGAVMLHEATGEDWLLAEVERAVADLLGSGDYLIDGGVHEFFGWNDPAHLESLGSLRSSQGDFGRNEGCTLSDLVRLTLHLHRLTGRSSYLEAAERCWLNAFSHNQFADGDFGHRYYFRHGFRPFPNLARAWWCCTMHGYRCFPEVMDSAVVMEDEGARVDLFEDLVVEGDAALSTESTGFGVKVRFTRGFDGHLVLRSPAWAASVHVLRDGAPATGSAEGGYVRLQGPFRSGEKVELAGVPRAEILTRDGRKLKLSELPDAGIVGSLLWGPYLMVVSEQDAPDFFGEPWEWGETERSSGNLVRLDADLSGKILPGRWPRLAAYYEHAGFHGVHRTTLRPLGLRPSRDQQIEVFRIPFART